MKTTLALLSILLGASAFAAQTAVHEGPVGPIAGPSAPAHGVSAVSVPAPALGALGELSAAPQPAQAAGVDGGLLSEPHAAASVAERQASAAAGESSGRTAGARVGALASGVQSALREVGDVSGGDAESAVGLGRSVQDAIGGGREISSRGAVTAGSENSSGAPLARSTSRRPLARAATVAAAAVSLFAASATPVLAAPADPVSTILAPASVLGIIVGVVVSLLIALGRRDDIMSWLKKAFGYVVTFGISGAAIGVVALMFGEQVARLDMIGVAVGAAASAAIALARWTKGNLDDAYDALWKTVGLVWSFGFAGVVVGVFGLIGGVTLAQPIGVGAVAGAAIALLIGAFGGQTDEWDWLKKAWSYMGVFAGFGLVVGILAYNFHPVVAGVTAVGLIAGAKLSLLPGVASFAQKRAADAYDWLGRAFWYMGTFGLVGLVLGTMANVGSLWLAWPAGIGFAVGALAIAVVDRADLFGSQDSQHSAWLTKSLLVGGFVAAIGFALGALALLGGFTPLVSGFFGAFSLSAWLPALPSSLPGSGVASAVLSFLTRVYVLWPTVAGVALGAILSFVLGRDVLRQNRGVWARNAALMTAIFGGLGLGIGSLIAGVLALFF